VPWFIGVQLTDFFRYEFAILIALLIRYRRLSIIRRAGVLMIAYLIATSVSNIGVMAYLSEG
jgi:hypothetical protein